jgi:hypothetical protein
VIVGSEAQLVEVGSIGRKCRHDPITGRIVDRDHPVRTGTPANGQEHSGRVDGDAFHIGTVQNYMDGQALVSRADDIDVLFLATHREILTIQTKFRLPKRGDTAHDLPISAPDDLPITQQKYLTIWGNAIGSLDKVLDGGWPI